LARLSILLLGVVQSNHWIEEQRRPCMSKTSLKLAPLAGALALLPLAAFADGPKLTGYATASYNYDFNDPASGANSSFNYYGGKTGSFQLNAAHLTLAGVDSAGATYGIDLDAGTDGTHNGGVIASSAGWAIDLQQAFVTLPLFKTPLSLTGGKFYTSEGIEVLNSAANPTVTRGILFGQMEPVAHTGAYLTFKFNDKISLSVGAVDGWDTWAISNADGNPVEYDKLSLNFGDPLALTVSSYYGPQYGTRDAFSSLDVTGVTKVIPNLALNFQANLLLKDKANADGTNSGNFGAGIQPVYTIGDGQIGARYEFASLDLHTVKFDNTTINSISVAPGYKMTQSSLLRVEYRIDLASNKIFEDDKGAGTDMDQTVTAELNYTF
jgi:hypothetical protein